jgi:hypothetical protein
LCLIQVSRGPDGTGKDSPDKRLALAWRRIIQIAGEVRSRVIVERASAPGAHAGRLLPPARQSSQLPRSGAAACITSEDATRYRPPQENVVNPDAGTTDGPLSSRRVRSELTNS